jgi:hypothetical protein
MSEGSNPMMKKFISYVIGCTASVLVMAAFVGLHAPSANSAQSQSSIPVLKREKIAVMPFLVGKFGPGLTGVMSCPLCELTTDPGSVALGSDKTLTQYVQEALERRHEDMAIPLQRVIIEFIHMQIDEAKDTPLTVARALGKRIGADYVIVGNVWRYKDRAGSTLATTSPASVAFALYLVEVASGRILWSDVFSETQRSLAENILQAKGFFEMGGKWVTADELALYGVKELFKRFPF